MNMFKKVLATIDLGDEDTSRAVLNGAMEVMSGDDSLHVLCVIPDYGMSVVGSCFPEDFEEKAIAKAKEALHEFTKKNVPDGTPVQHIVGHGRIYEEIIAAAETISADLIVVGSHRPVLKDYLLGPNASRVVRHSNRSVLVVRPD